jgi:hypothetical protein
MPRVILITNPAHDEATEYLKSWSEGIISGMGNLPTETNILELKHTNVTRDKLSDLINNYNPQLILFHGHGGGRMILGFEAEILVDCDDNEILLSNRIIHSLSCDSGKELGPKCIVKGTKAYIGYKEEFQFAHLGKTTDFERYRDPIAKLFFKPAFEINRALLQGETVGAAYKKSQKMYADNIQSLLLSNSGLSAILIGKVYHNMIHQVSLGDQMALI